MRDCICCRTRDGNCPHTSCCNDLASANSTSTLPPLPRWWVDFLVRLDDPFDPHPFPCSVDRPDVTSPFANGSAVLVASATSTGPKLVAVTLVSTCPLCPATFPTRQIKSSSRRTMSDCNFIVSAFAPSRRRYPAAISMLCRTANNGFSLTSPKSSPSNPTSAGVNGGLELSAGVFVSAH